MTKYRAKSNRTPLPNLLTSKDGLVRLIEEVPNQVLAVQVTGYLQTERH